MKKILLIMIIISTILFGCTSKVAPGANQDVVTIERGDYDVVENKDTSQGIVNEIIDMVQTCKDLDGVWIDEYDECEGISQEECEYLDGLFYECESACRHNPAEQACTLQCVQVCSFE